MSPPARTQPSQATASASKLDEKRDARQSCPEHPGLETARHCEPASGATEQRALSSDDDVCDLMGEYDELPDHRAPASGPHIQPQQPSSQHHLDHCAGGQQPTKGGRSLSSGSTDGSELFSEDSVCYISSDESFTDRSDTDLDQCSEQGHSSDDDGGSGHFSTTGSSSNHDRANGFRRDISSQKLKICNGQMSKSKSESKSNSESESNSPCEMLRSMHQHSWCNSSKADAQGR